MKEPKKSNVKINREPLNASEVKTAKSWNASNILWGLLLVLLGTLFLLQNFGVLSIDLTDAWRLWPVFIIAAGVSILSVRGLLGGMIVTLLIVLVLALTSFVMLGGAKPNESNVNMKMFEVSLSNDDVERAILDIDAGAGTINVGSDRDVRIVKGNLESSFADLKTNSKIRDSRQEIDLLVEGDSGWWSGNYKNDLDITLGTTLPYELSIDTGASNISADLSEVLIEKLNLQSGASEIEIKLGDRASAIDITFDIGVSSATFKLPRSVGVSLELDSGLSDVSADGLKKIDENTYQSDNFTTAGKKIALKGKAGVSNLRIELY